MSRLVIPVLVSATLLGGCALAPTYSRPASPVPPAFSDAASGAASAAPSIADMRWQDYFVDQRVRMVISLALANNRDLRVASLNVERAQALYRVQRGALLPGIGAQATGDVTRVPEKLSGNDAATSEQYAAVIGMPSWEVDLFGRLRSLKAAALEQYFATEHAHAAAQVSLVAAVAATYLQIAADRESLDLSRATLAAQQSTLGLIERSQALGVATGLDVAQARSQVDVARADVALFEGAVAIDRHALDLVVGATVTDDLLPAGLQAVSDAVDLPGGMPSAVLLHRPDILAAEARLKAANASIGAARAAFFPRISLTAGLGSASADLASLLQSGTGTWSFAPQIVAPLFAGGTLKANLRAARVEREIAVAQYEQSIQVAFREVSDALSARPALTAQHAAITSLVEQLSTAHRLSDARYRAGMDGYLGVLVAQRSLFAAQRSLVGVRLAEQANQVALYKVLGGGVQ